MSPWGLVFTNHSNRPQKKGSDINMKNFKKFRFALIPLAVLFILLPLSSAVMAADPIPKVNLGSTESYAVLAGSTITNTGSTVIDGNFGGDIGLYPGTSITGFPPGTVGGTTHVNDDSAIKAKTDLVTAYNDAAGRTSTKDMSGTDLGGQTLTTGVYKFSSAAKLTGTLTLDAQGDPEAVFIFQIGSALTTATSSEVKLINGARFCRVFWQVTSSATLGTTTKFVGHILALQSITCNTGATVQGQLLARNGAVTLDSNKVTNGSCPTITGATTPTTPSGGTTELTKTAESGKDFILIGGLLLITSGAFMLLLISRRAHRKAYKHV